MGGKDRYVSVSLFKGVSDAVDELMRDIGYWSNKSEFLREAALEKIRRERHNFDGAIRRNRSKETGEMSEEEKKKEEEEVEEEAEEKAEEKEEEEPKPE